MKSNRKLIEAATHMNISPSTGEVVSYLKPLVNKHYKMGLGAYGNLFFSPEFERLVMNMDVVHRLFFYLCKNLMVGNNTVNLKTSELANQLGCSERQLLRAKKELITNEALVQGCFAMEVNAQIFCKGNKNKLDEVRSNQKKALTSNLKQVIKDVKKQADEKWSADNFGSDMLRHTK